MKNLIILGLVGMLLVTMFCGFALAGSGDENFNGEDGEQPAPGAEDSPGEGLPSEAPDKGDRTRNFL